MQSKFEWLLYAKEAARLGGVELMSRLGTAKISEKAPKDLVTEADLASQNAIYRYVKENCDDHFFVGEEEIEGETISAETASSGLNAPCWIVDPLDGTANYSHQLSPFSVSIGILFESAVHVGVVYDPTNDEMFSAIKGVGAWLNDIRLKPSECTAVEKAMMVASFSAGVARDSPECERFLRMIDSSQTIRRLGSCALNLSYVAAGRVDGYWATGVKVWDAAAGHLIAQEAGAEFTTIEGTEVDLWNPKFLCSANSTLHSKLLPILQV